MPAAPLFGQRTSVILPLGNNRQVWAVAFTVVAERGWYYHGQDREYQWHRHFPLKGAPGLSTGQDGAGGGGAGGTVYVVAENPVNISNISADVRGGDGGWSTFPEAHGPGGGGGGGVVVSTNGGVSILPGGLDGGQAGKAGPTNNADANDGTHGARAGTGLTAPSWLLVTMAPLLLPVVSPRCYWSSGLRLSTAIVLV